MLLTFGQKYKYLILYHLFGNLTTYITIIYTQATHASQQALLPKFAQTQTTQSTGSQRNLPKSCFSGSGILFYLALLSLQCIAHTQFFVAQTWDAAMNFIQAEPRVIEGILEQKILLLYPPNLGLAGLSYGGTPAHTTWPRPHL